MQWEYPVPIEEEQQSASETDDEMDICTTPPPNDEHHEAIGLLNGTIFNSSAHTHTHTQFLIFMN